MSALLASLRRESDRLGLAGIIGIALLAFAGMFTVSAVLPLRDQAASLREEAAALHERLGAGQAAPAKAAIAEQLATFYAFFPAPEHTPEWLGKIHALAKANGLQLDAGEYRFERNAASRLARYQMTLPVQGNYGQIRAFVGAVLEEVPAAVLEDVALKRDSVESQRIEARLRLTLYLGKS